MNTDNDPTYDAMPLDLSIFSDEQLDNIFGSDAEGEAELGAEATGENFEVIAEGTETYDYIILHEDLGLLHIEMLRLNNFVSLIFAFIFLYMIYRVFRTCWNILYGWFFSDV